MLSNITTPRRPRAISKNLTVRLFDLLLRSDALTFGYDVYNTTMDPRSDRVSLNKVTLVGLCKFLLNNGEACAFLCLFSPQDLGTSMVYRASVVDEDHVSAPSEKQVAPPSEEQDAAEVLRTAFAVLGFPPECAKRVLPIVRTILMSQITVPLGFVLRVLHTSTATSPTLASSFFLGATPTRHEDVFLFGNELFDSLMETRTRRGPFVPKSIKQLLSARLPPELGDQFAHQTEARKSLTMQLVVAARATPIWMCANMDEYTIPEDLARQLKTGLPVALMQKKKGVHWDWPVAWPEELAPASTRASIIGNLTSHLLEPGDIQFGGHPFGGDHQNGVGGPKFLGDLTHVLFSEWSKATLGESFMREYCSTPEVMEKVGGLFWVMETHTKSGQVNRIC